MSIARVVLAGVLSAFLVPACAPVTPEEIAAAPEALTVCHTTVVEGVDVAEFQGNVDWNMVHNSGRGFGIARIGDGTYSDPTFARNYAGMRAAGMVRGAYLFWRPTVGAATQAAAILGAVGTLGPGDLPPTIDVECMCPFLSGGACASSSASSCVSPATAAADLTDLYNRLRAGLGRSPMIYTGAWFWDGGTYLAGASSFPSAPLWVSGYTSGCVSVPSGWSDWQIWQYSDGSCSGCVTTPVPGIPGGGRNVDRNRWNGDLASLMAFTGGGTPPTDAGMPALRYGAAFVMQSFPYASVGPVRIPAGGTQAAWIDLRNTGTATWDASTCLGTTVARDRPSPFAALSWVNDHRLVCVPGGTTVAPGATHRFSWTWSVPAGAAAGMYAEHYDLLEEGVAWFGDPGQGGPPDMNIEAIIEVTPGIDSGMPPVDAYVPPMNDAYVPNHDAGPMRDAGAMARDAGAANGDGALAMNDDGGGMSPPRALTGSCGCSAAGAGSSRGASLLALALAAIVLARRTAKRAA